MLNFMDSFWGASNTGTGHILSDVNPNGMRSRKILKEETHKANGIVIGVCKHKAIRMSELIAMRSHGSIERKSIYIYRRLCCLTSLGLLLKVNVRQK